MSKQHDPSMEKSSPPSINSAQNRAPAHGGKREVPATPATREGNREPPEATVPASDEEAVDQIVDEDQQTG